MKLARGAKKRFIYKLLKEGNKLSQEGLRLEANKVDPRLYSSRLAAYINEFRKHHVIKTHMMPNKNCNGEHAVYEYIEPLDVGEIIKTLKE